MTNLAAGFHSKRKISKNLSHKIMKQLLNKLVERVKRIIFMQKGLSWCNKVISQQNEKVKVPQNVLIAYKARWKKLSRFVSKKYLLCFASKVEISSIAEIAPEDIVHHYMQS